MTQPKKVFKPLNSKRTFENIADQIKEAIFSKALKPNDKLPSERELAQQFNAGRMSVREALRTLEESGFITIKQGVEGGIFVNEMNTTGITKSLSGLISAGDLSIQEIRDARLTIESCVLESVIKHFTKKQLTKLESNIENCEKKYESRKKKKYPITSDIELGAFHILLAEISKNRFYRYLLVSLLDLYTIGVIKYVPDSKDYFKHLNQHREILNAIKSKDLEQAKDILKSHINSSLPS